MLSKFDLFSTAFQLSFKKKESVKTAGGGILSIYVVIIGLVYLIYLIYNWLSGNI